MADQPEVTESAETSETRPATHWHNVDPALRKTGAPPVSPTAAVAELMPHYSKLRPNLKRYAELLAGGESGAAAVRILRPRSRRPRELAWKLRKSKHLKEAVEELQQHARAAFFERELRHKQGIYNRANADRTPLAVPEFWETDPRTWPLELKDCIESVEFKDGKVSKITLSNRNEAARLFSQHMGWMVERKELTGKDGAPLQTTAPTVYVIGSEEAAEIRAELSAEV